MSRRAIVYLHGFASSPRSSKARFFGERAAALGWAYTCPDLNEPDFATLTVSRMIDQVEAAVKSLTSILEPLMICVVGSIVGFMILAMYLPMFHVYDAIK